MGEWPIPVLPNTKTHGHQIKWENVELKDKNMPLYTIRFSFGSSCVNIMAAKYWVKKIMEYSWKNTDYVL